MFKATNTLKAKHQFGRTLVLAASVLSMLLLAGCISSSRSYNNDKNIVYNGTMYNMGNVKQVKTIVSGTMHGDQQMDLKNVTKKQFAGLLDQEKQIYVRMSFEFDDQELVYRAGNVTSWSQFTKMKNSFVSAGNQISKLMSDKKKIQLKLK